MRRNHNGNSNVFLTCINHLPRADKARDLGMKVENVEKFASAEEGAAGVHELCSEIMAMNAKKPSPRKGKPKFTGNYKSRRRR